MLISSFLDEKTQHRIAAFTLGAIVLSQERYPQSMGNGVGSPLNSAIAQKAYLWSWILSLHCLF